MGRLPAPLTAPAGKDFTLTWLASCVFIWYKLSAFLTLVGKNQSGMKSGGKPVAFLPNTHMRCNGSEGCLETGLCNGRMEDKPRIPVAIRHCVSV